MYVMIIHTSLSLKTLRRKLGTEGTEREGYNRGARPGPQKKTMRGDCLAQIQWEPGSDASWCRVRGAS